MHKLIIVKLHKKYISFIGLGQAIFLYKIGNQTTQRV